MYIRCGPRSVHPCDELRIHKGVATPVYVRWGTLYMISDSLITTTKWADVLSLRSYSQRVQVYWGA